VWRQRKILWTRKLKQKYEPTTTTTKPARQRHISLATNQQVWGRRSIQKPQKATKHNKTKSNITFTQDASNKLRIRKKNEQNPRQKTASTSQKKERKLTKKRKENWRLLKV
jgi:hypothetical protein